MSNRRIVSLHRHTRRWGDCLELRLPGGLVLGLAWISAAHARRVRLDWWHTEPVVRQRHGRIVWTRRLGLGWYLAPRRALELEAAS